VVNIGRKNMSDIVLLTFLIVAVVVFVILSIKVA
jgi:hypothetical protein